MSVTERIADEAAQLERVWQDARWGGIQRDYSAEDVVKLRGSVRVEHTLARRGAEKLWQSIEAGQYVHALGAYSGAQAVNMVKAGLRSIYLSGWQVAGDANLAGETYPDQSLYPSNSVPQIVKRINSALVRADQIAW
jgi:isocitrate lyase